MYVHVEALVPIRVQSLLDHARCARLLAIDGRHGERVREACVAVSTPPPQRGGERTEHISFVEAVGSDNLELLAGRQKLGGPGPRSDVLVTRKLGWPAASMVGGQACERKARKEEE